MNVYSWRPQLGWFVGCLLLLAGCGQVVEGSGHVITQGQVVADFSAVDLAGPGQLIIEQTGEESLTITTDDNLFAFLESQVVEKRLKLGPKGDMSLKPTQGIVYRLTTRQLGEIQLMGSAKVEASRLDAPQLIVAISGSGDADLAGRAEQLTLSVAGSGNYQGHALNAKTATITIAGSGHAVVAVSDKLDVTVAGSGNIEYVGEPTVTKTIVGSGTVRKK